MEKSVPLLQFCCDTKTTLKIVNIKIIFRSHKILKVTNVQWKKVPIGKELCSMKV